MPTRTFFNLPDEKRRNLVDAAMREFSRTSLADASVANIIKDACIPRGSFYQYFEDKSDIFFYLLEEHSSRNQQLLLKLAAENQGNLFVSSAQFFAMTLHRFTNDEHHGFARNIFLNMNYKIEYKLIMDVRNSAIGKREGDFYREYMNLIDRKGLNIRDDRELFHLIKILRAMMIQNFTQYFAGEASEAAAVQNFELELELLKRGLYTSLSVDN